MTFTFCSKRDHFILPYIYPPNEACLCLSSDHTDQRFVQAVLMPGTVPVILSLYALLLELILNRGPNRNVGQMAPEPWPKILQVLSSFISLNELMTAERNLKQSMSCKTTAKKCTKKVCCTCEGVFLLIRPIVVVSPFSLPLPLSVMLYGTIRSDDF